MTDSHETPYDHPNAARDSRFTGSTALPQLSEAALMGVLAALNAEERALHPGTDTSLGESGKNQKTLLDYMQKTEQTQE